MGKEISLSDFAMLKKCMGVTTSANDHEALIALRKANQILAKHGATWEDIFTRLVGTNNAPVGVGGFRYANGSKEADVEEESTDLPIPVQISKAFNELRGVSLRNRSFIDSLEIDFLNRNWLTEAQRAPLFRTVRAIRRERGK